MDQRTLGNLTASAIGLGTMGLTGSYGPADYDESIATVRRAADLGITLFDTSEAYGPFTAERLLGEALKDRRDRVSLVTKFGIIELDDDGSQVGGACGRPDYVRHSVDRSLQNLGTDRIDLYLQHRLDPRVPVEETFGALGELVQAGKIRHVGLSEVSPATIRRAHAVVPLTAVETEYSLFARDVETNGVLATTRELGIGFLAYAPLGRGMLTGAVTIGDGDLRNFYPRFEAGNLESNLRVVDKLTSIAKPLGLTVAQLALAWLLTAAPDAVPVPGTRGSAHVAENVTAAGVRLDTATRQAVEAAAPPSAIAGSRLSPADPDIERF
jgi:aryl-alcohol dehydrogenase-like predicted oxidoreductase